MSESWESCNLLLIEDHDDSRNILVKLLRSMGYTIEGARDGEEGLRIFSEKMPNVVILDLGLPDMSGFEVANTIRERYGEGTTIIALTGHSLTDEERRSKAAVFDSYVYKPVDFAKLSKVLESYCSI